MFEMWQPKNFREAILPIRIIGWLFGLGTIHYPLNHPRIGLSIFNVLITIFMYVATLKYILPVVRHMDVIHTQQIIMLVIAYANIIVHLSNIILTWIWKAQAKSIHLEAMEIDEILDKLKVPLDYRSIFIYSSKIAICWLSVALSTNIINMIWYINEYDLITNFFITFILQHPVHASAINAMNFWITMELMKCRFRKMNELILNMVNKENNGQRLDVNRNWPPTPMSISVENNSVRCISTPQNSTNEILRMSKQIHLKLSSLCIQTTKIFGIQIATALISSMVMSACFMFFFYVIGFNLTSHSSWKLYRFLLLTIRVVSHCVKVYSINSCCAETIKEWQKTGAIIHELKLVSRNNAFLDEIRQFSLQMIQNPLSLTACGLVTLGYEFIHGFVGAVTTFVIILLQMYTS